MGSMALVNWNESYSVGVPSLDAQHKQLIEALNALHDAMSNGQAADRMKTLVGKLGQYANTHLQTEENLLTLNNFRGFAEHKAEHDAYVTKMRNFEKDLNNGKKIVSVELLTFLREWWTGHILNSDKKYAELLKSRGVN